MIASLSLILVAFAALTQSQTTDTLFVDDLLTHSTVNHTWMEIGYANLTDTEWTTVTTTVNVLNPQNNREMSVFMSLPEYGGPTAEDGWSMVVKMNGRATRLTNGAYQFQARLVQPNDSYCPKLWWTPKASPTINVGWLIVEEGVYNVSSSMLVFGSGEITRDNTVPLLKDDTPALYHAKYTMNYTTGCDENDIDAVCEFIEKVSDFPVVPVPNGPDRAYSTTGWSHLGATNQIQTSVNKVPNDHSKELWMNTRVRNVFPDRITMMLAVHSVFVNDNNPEFSTNVGPDRYNFTLYPDYADIHTAEVASYFVWEKNMRLSCIEGLVMETSIQFPVTSFALSMDYFYEFETVPGLFGMIGTLQSVGDTTSLRVFNRSLESANFITQEDQCTDEEETHINPEAAFSMVVGKAKNVIGNTHCFIAYDVQPCTYTIYLYDLFMDGWDNVELVVDTGLEEPLTFTTSCGAKKVTFTSHSCSWTARMQTTDGKQPITWWENYWSYEHESIGFEYTYIGDYDSTIMVEREIVTYTDLANTRVDAKENKCEQCKVAPPPPAKGGKGNKGPGDMGPGEGEGDGDGNGDGNAGNGGVADLTAGKIAPAAPGGVGVYPGDAAGPWGTLQITGVSGAIDSSAPAGSRSYTVVYALNVVALSSAVESITFNRGAYGVVGPAFHSLDVTGLMTDFFLEGSFDVSEADIILWINGEIYIQVNTANHLTGEIRAQAVLPSDWMDYYSYMNGDKHGSDDMSGDGFGHSAGGHGPDGDSHKSGSGRGASHGHPAPVPVLIELFDDAGEGWYNHSGTWSYPMKTVPDADRRRLHQAIAIPARQTVVMDYSVATFPDILMYPTYVIMNAEKTQQLHVGSLCPHREVERCEERLPPVGEFVFRVMGKDLEEDDHWKFCGVHGHIGQELQFEMKKGKCVPISLTNAYTFCSLNTLVTVSGSLTLAGVTADFSEVDSKVLENEVASMLVSTTLVSINSWQVNEEGNMEIAFEAILVAEKQGVDGSLRSNVDTLVSSLSSNMVTAFSSGAFLSSLDTALAEHPQDLMSITHATGAFLTKLEVADIQYVEASTTISDRTDAAVPAYQADAVVEEQGAQQGVSVIAQACAVVGVVVVVAALALRTRRSSTESFTHQELAVDSEHADHIPEFDLGLEPATPKGMFFTSKERF